MYELHNATDLDENANHKTNVGYTMALMKTHIDTTNSLRIRLGTGAKESWSNVSELIRVPTDESANIIKEYQTMNGSISVKQADVVLVDDFLSIPTLTREAT